jgi:hypothetical protein
MVSIRKRKKEAAKAGLTEPELAMLEICDQMLERFRWLQVLVHAQSFLLRERLKIPDGELDGVLRAASQAVEKDATLRRWEEGLARLKGDIVEGRRAIRRERKKLARGTRGEAAAARSEGAG